MAGIALALAMRIPLAVLGNTGSAAEVAYFSAAQRFGDAAYVLAITGGFALLPGIAYLAKAEPDRARRLVRRVLVPVVAGSVAVSLVAIPLARADHAPGLRRALRRRRGPLPDHRRRPAGLRGPRAVLVRDRGLRRGRRDCSRSGVTSFLLCVVLSLLLVPATGDDGAAWAYLITLCVTAALYVWRPRAPAADRWRRRGRGRTPPADRGDADGGRAVSDAVPRVSVVLPAYNAEGTIRRAIDSVLAQTMPDFELLVIDDGSEDGTGDVVRAVEDARIRYVRRPHAGLPQTLNAGLAEARAPVVAVQDADDWSAPQRLERQLAVLDARAEVAVVGSRMPEVDADGRELTARAPFEAGDAYHVLMRFNPISNPSSAYRREVVAALGGYDRRYGCAPEYDLWLRVSDRHVVLAVDEPLAIRTLDGTNLSTVRERTCIRDTIHMRVRAMRRRRSLRGLGSLLRVVASYLLPTQVKHARRRRRGQAI